jgi:hypothetical protein
MANELMTLETVKGGEQGVVGGNQGSFAFLGVGLFVLLSCTNQCLSESVFYCKGKPNSLDKQILTQDLARGNPKRTL